MLKMRKAVCRRIYIYDCILKINNKYMSVCMCVCCEPICVNVIGA